MFKIMYYLGLTNCEYDTIKKFEELRKTLKQSNATMVDKTHTVLMNKFRKFVFLNNVLWGSLFLLSLVAFVMLYKFDLHNDTGFTVRESSSSTVTPHISNTLLPTINPSALKPKADKTENHPENILNPLNSDTKMVSVQKGNYIDFRSSDNKFGITFPKDWEGYEDSYSSNTNYYFINSTCTDKCFVLLSITANKNITQNEYSSFLTTFNDNYFKSFSSIKPYGIDDTVKVGSAQIGLRHRVSVTETSSKKDIYYDEVVFSTSSDVFLLIFVSDQSIYAKTVKDFDNALANFNLIIQN